jgi:localization factor PodJL
VAEAYFWFALAGRQQDANALQKQDEIGRQLTPAEREKMDSIVAAWKPKARIEDVNRVAPEPPAAAQGDDKPVGPTPVAAAPNTAVMRASWKPDIAPVSRSSAQTEMIAEAQRLLKRMGYEAGPVDGRQGPRTQAAVRSFQRRAGLAETGQITQALIVKMAFLPL